MSCDIQFRKKIARGLPWAAAIMIVLTAGIAWSAWAQNIYSTLAASRDSWGSQAQSDKPDKQSDGQSKNAAPAMTKIKIQVNDPNDKPVSNAAVYIGFYESGGFLHHDKMAELDLKTDQEGSVKAPDIPQGRIRIQVIAKGWHTFGKWYDIDKPEETVEIKLQQPPHWY